MFLVLSGNPVRPGVGHVLFPANILASKCFIFYLVLTKQNAMTRILRLFTHVITWYLSLLLINSYTYINSLLINSVKFNENWFLSRVLYLSYVCPHHLHGGKFLPLLGSAQKLSDFDNIRKVHAIQCICFLNQHLYGICGGPLWWKIFLHLLVIR